MENRGAKLNLVRVVPPDRRCRYAKKAKAREPRRRPPTAPPTPAPMAVVVVTIEVSLNGAKVSKADKVNLPDAAVSHVE